MVQARKDRGRIPGFHSEIFMDQGLRLVEFEFLGRFAVTHVAGHHSAGNASVARKGRSVRAELRPPVFDESLRLVEKLMIISQCVSRVKTEK